jgi:hypothetical protein
MRQCRDTRSGIERAKSRNPTVLLIDCGDEGGDVTRGENRHRRSSGTNMGHSSPQLNHSIPSFTRVVVSIANIGATPCARNSLL